MLANLLTLGVALLVSGLLAEATVLLVHGEQPKFPRHVVAALWGLRYNEPNAEYRHKSADMTTTFRINAQGMRDDRDFAYAKPLGVKRIVSLGDSFTIGYEVDVDRTFSSVLERELRAAGHRVEVLNAGVSGFSNAEELLYLERELIRYAPDLVLVSFYGNDFVDNVRTGLFALEGDELVALSHDYVPAGRLGNFLNTNWVFNFLSERSNAFVFVKEEATKALKRAIVEQGLRRIDEAAAKAEAGGGAAAEPEPEAAAEADYESRLAVAILERMYAFCRERGIPLVIQSIPDLLPPATPGAPPEQWDLVELFPAEAFDFDRPGVAFAPARDWLEAQRDGRLLYWMRSHRHWTPLSHEISGRGLARLVLRERLLE